MKEELKALKDSAVQIIKEKDSLKKQKNFFNMKVEEKVAELNMEEIFKEDGSSYEAAVMLNYLFPQIYNIVASIREQHPKYGEKRVKEITLIALNEIMTETDYLMSFSEYTDKIIDNYFLYEGCGFFKLKEQEEKIETLEDGAKVSTDTILNQSKEVAIKAGKSIKNIAKPYGDVAKSQFEDASKAAKTAINKGSKKLIKILKDIENKTNNDEK